MALRVARMALALASLPLGVVAQLADMDVAFDDGLDFLNGGPYGGLNAVTMSPYEMYKWPWGTIPQRCYTGASEDDLCSPYDMEVYDVWFPDCYAPWKMCRCRNSPMTAEALANRMSQIPVNARQWIRFWSTYNGTLSAGNGGNDITVFGDASDSTSIFFHEVAHSLDSWAMGPEYEGSAFSDQDLWQSIVASDTCVPDDYARVSYNENYAQVYVMIAYNTQVRSIWNYDVKCMASQLIYGQDLLEHLVDYYPKAECTRRWSEEDSPRVCMGPLARRRGRCRGVPDPEKPPVETPGPTPVPTPTPEPTPIPEEVEGTPRIVKGMPVGVAVDEIAKPRGIAVKPNRAEDPEKQRILEAKDAARWRETLEKAGVRRH
ncbi:conidiation-specific protein 13 [Sarocladium implicatum]|nr:conidiation-specific protein 13 [Sarocladium implicatum]